MSTANYCSVIDRCRSVTGHSRIARCSGNASSASSNHASACKYFGWYRVGYDRGKIG